MIFEAHACHVPGTTELTDRHEPVPHDDVEAWKQGRSVAVEAARVHVGAVSPVGPARRPGRFAELCAHLA